MLAVVFGLVGFSACERTCETFSRWVYVGGDVVPVGRVVLVWLCLWDSSRLLWVKNSLEIFRLCYISFQYIRYFVLLGRLMAPLPKRIFCG